MSRYKTSPPPPVTEPEAELRHRETAMTKLSPIGRRYFELIEFDANEDLICEIRKHPIGLWFVYAIGGLFGIALMTIAVFISGIDASATAGYDFSTMKGPVIALMLVLIIVDIIITAIGGMIYKSNVIYVTNEKIAQVIYRTIIDRKISQLSIGDVQDVSVSQYGILSRIFKYGTLVVETAGEQQNYTFTFVPFPYQVSRAIVAAHEKYVAQYGN